MKRTKKEFTPYNEYHDRPFELKWATAFALGELQEGIEASDEYSKRAFERLPQQIARYFNNNSLIVLFPDQYGDPQETVSFSDPGQHHESPNYESVGQWFYKWFKKK